MIGKGRGRSTHLFCSQAVAEAYKRAGIDLLPSATPANVTPHLLEKSPHLESVKLPLIEVEINSADIRFFIERLLKAFPGIIAGVKDSSGDWNNTAAMLKDFQPHGFDVFAGTETILLKNMRGGGAGCITATGNVNPTAIMRLYKTWQAVDADVQQEALNKTRAIFQKVPIIPAMKAAIAEKSGDKVWATVPPPLVELNDAQRGQLMHELDENGLGIPNAAELADRT